MSIMQVLNNGMSYSDFDFKYKNLTNQKMIRGKIILKSILSLREKVSSNWFHHEIDFFCQKENSSMIIICIPGNFYTNI